jgi:hypothetical protein
MDSLFIFLLGLAIGGLSTFFIICYATKTRKRFDE